MPQMEPMGNGAFIRMDSLKNCTFPKRFEEEIAMASAFTPDRFIDEQELEEFMSRPSKDLLEDLSRIEGDILILGVGGKMGPTLARLAKRALVETGRKNRVIGVSRFTNPNHRKELEGHGVETISADLLDPDQVRELPNVSNVIYLVGMKFGTTGAESKTWAVNTITPTNVCRHFNCTRIVALSTGNVYPLTTVHSSGPTEADPVGPIGEYAQSALARERLFQYFSEEKGIPISILRLNYAIDVRYGVLVDIAQKVRQGLPIDLSMGFANVIWQGDANERILRSLHHCAKPAEVLNLTGSDIVSIRELAINFAERFKTSPVLIGEESGTALLSNPAKSEKRWGKPRVALDQMVDWVSRWVEMGGSTLGKPTHFEARDGKF